LIILKHSGISSKINVHIVDLLTVRDKKRQRNYSTQN